MTVSPKAGGLGLKFARSLFPLHSSWVGLGGVGALLTGERACWRACWHAMAVLLHGRLKFGHYIGHLRALALVFFYRVEGCNPLLPQGCPRGEQPFTYLVRWGEGFAKARLSASAGRTRCVLHEFHRSRQHRHPATSLSSRCRCSPS